MRGLAGVAGADGWRAQGLTAGSTSGGFDALHRDPVADHAEAQVVGGERRRSWGGEVRLADLVQGRSASAVLARARA